MKYGYIRISTPNQSFDQQEEALRELGVIAIEKEIVSGKKKERAGLESILKRLREGDELHVTRLDRLGRTAEELHQIGRRLQELGVALVVGGEKTDPKTPQGKMFFGMLATFAEFEADLIAERTRERLAVMRLQGKPIGRKTSLSERQDAVIWRAVRNEGRSISEMARIYSVSRPTIDRALEREQVKRDLVENPAIRREYDEMQDKKARLERDLKTSAREGMHPVG